MIRYFKKKFCITKSLFFFVAGWMFVVRTMKCINISWIHILPMYKTRRRLLRKVVDYREQHFRDLSRRSTMMEDGEARATTSKTGGWSKKFLLWNHFHENFQWIRKTKSEKYDWNNQIRNKDWSLPFPVFYVFSFGQTMAKGWIWRGGVWFWFTPCGRWSSFVF